MKYLLLLLFLSKQTFCQQPIDTVQHVQIGGIKQYIRITGKDRSKPLLLFLHGGPGSSILHKSAEMTSRLQRFFVVVHWDQRETGETLRRNKSTVPLTLALFCNDTRDLADSLLRQFARPKLYLAGYSWGSALGFHIAGQYPHWLYAFIAVSPVINQWKSEQLSLDLMKKRGGKKARKELAAVKIPFENAAQLYYHRKWLFRLEQKKLINVSLQKSFVLTWGATWFDVFRESCSVNLFESLPRIDCPVYFFAGEKDIQTNHVITQDYYQVLTAPKKDLFLFADAGHGLPETDAVLFQDTIIEIILPQTIRP